MGTDRAEEYRRNAVEAERLAATASTREMREEFLKLAQGWLRLAEEAEGQDGGQQA